MNLYPFQEQAVSQMLDFLQSNETHSVYNACEQGLGKTIQTITTLNRLKVRRVLIVCPAIMRLVWLDELKKWWGDKSFGDSWFTGDMTVASAVLSSADAHLIKTSEIVIISYDLARTPSVLAFLKAEKFECMVFDEAHALKNTRAKRTKVCFRELWDMAKYHILLSGTPFTVSVVDGYSPFHRILPSEFPDFHDFVSRFSYARQTPWGMQYFGLKNAEALKKIIRSKFYLRYTKDEVLKELPPKIFQRITLPIEYAVDPKGHTDAEKLKVEAEMVRRFLEEGKNPVIPSSLAEHRRLQGEAKVEPVCEFIDNQLQTENPTVVFAHHRKVIADIAERFRQAKPSVITGDTSAENRRRAIQAFQGGDTNLFIGNYVAAGTGITLTRSSTCILAELDWSPAILAQAWDRLHRISQSRPVNIYWFVVQNSLDETISNVVMNRAKLFKTVLE